MPGVIERCRLPVSLAGAWLAVLGAANISEPCGCRVAAAAFVVDCADLGLRAAGLIHRRLARTAGQLPRCSALRS
jgi:hypothetical protein